MRARDEHPRETIFGETHYASAYPDGIEGSWWNLARSRIIEQEVRRNGTRDDLIIDIGCGRGIVVQHLRAAGLAAVGCELASCSPLAGAAPFVRTGLNAVDLPLAERSRYRIALLCDVIEHLPDDAGFIAQIISAFPALEYVIVTVPARQEIWSNYDEHYGHFRRYSRRTLHDVATRIGCELEHARYLFHALWPIIALTRLTAGRRAVALSPPAPGMHWAHRFLAAGFLLEARLIPGAIPGSSLICTFRVGRRVP